MPINITIAVAVALTVATHGRYAADIKGGYLVSQAITGYSSRTMKTALAARLERGIYFGPARGTI